MNQERKKFESRFLEEEKEIIVLTKEGAYAGRVGQEKLWLGGADVLALVDMATGQLKEEKAVLQWQMTEEECQAEGKVFGIEREKIYKLKVRESLPTINEYIGKEMKQGQCLWLLEVLERDCCEDRLEAILKEFQRPVTIQPIGCEELLLDKNLWLFSGKGNWTGEICGVHLEADEAGSESAKEAEAIWQKLLEDSEKWDEQARRFAAENLIDSANDWRLEDEEEITEEEFAKRLTISEIAITPDGEFEFYYDDDNMFAGHVVIVSGNVEEGMEEATFAG